MNGGKLENLIREYGLPFSFYLQYGERDIVFKNSTASTMDWYVRYWLQIVFHRSILKERIRKRAFVKPWTLLENGDINNHNYY